MPSVESAALRPRQALASERLHVLLADDHAHEVSVAAGVLEDLGHAVTVVNRYADAEKELRSDAHYADT
jgi:CheY-like chemotaxis protein